MDYKRIVWFKEWRTGGAEGNWITISENL